MDFLRSLEGKAQFSSSVDQIVAGAATDSLPTGNCGSCALEAICVISGLYRKDPVEVGALFYERRFKAREILSREGVHGNRLRVVKAGTVYLCRSGSRGHANPIAVVGPGTVVGMCSYFGQPNQLGVVAATSGRYCEISTEVVVTLARGDQHIWDQMGLAFSASFGQLAKWTEAIGRPRIPERVANCLRLLVEVQRSSTVRLPSHVVLARLLGTTRESVTRALAMLEAEGCMTRRERGVCEVMPMPLSQWLSRQS